MATNIISTPIPTYASRSSIEDLAHKTHYEICGNNDLTNMCCYMQLPKALNMNMCSSGLGGSNDKPLTLLCYNSKEIDCWKGGFMNMYSRQRENTEMLLSVAHVVLHLPMVYKKYGNDSLMQVMTINKDDSDDKDLKRARIEAIWFALYLALPHDKLSVLINSYGVDNARNWCNVIQSWFDASIKRMEQLKYGT